MGSLYGSIDKHYGQGTLPEDPRSPAWLHNFIVMNQSVSIKYSKQITSTH